MQVNLLLDTHVFIWWRSAPQMIRAATRSQIASGTEVYVSVASAWEAAINISLGKLRLAGDFEQGIADSGFAPLPISFDHARDVMTLPHHHRDPFDRMLIAQAQRDGLTVVTSDRVFAQYGVPVSWA